MLVRKVHRGVLVALLLLAGCNLLTPLVFLGEHKKKIMPEFDKLPGRRVAILVWTEAATLFDYPHARFELASYIWEKLAMEMAQRKLRTEVVDPRDVEDFIQKDVDAQINPHTVGRHMDADYCIYVEIIEFQIRDARQPQFLQGRIVASVSVHDIRADPDQQRRFELAPVRTIYPDKSPVLMSATNAVLIREATYRKFAEEVARKFYEYTVAL